MTFVDFNCKKCDAVFEKKYDFLKDIQKEEPCPTCGETCERHYGRAPAIKFIGPGFYVNDSRSK